MSEHYPEAQVTRYIDIDAWYVFLGNDAARVKRTSSESRTVNIDYDKDGNVVGIEIL